LAVRRWKGIVLFVGAVLGAVYLSGPVIASVYEIGDRRGPKTYPAVLHEAIYIFVWELTPHESKKPRLPAVWQAEHRPWFYGQDSKNEDSVWLDAEHKRLQGRLRRQRRQHGSVRSANEAAGVQ
jgi:hypothetical protein